jgi:hypothetical protein
MPYQVETITFGGLRKTVHGVFAEQAEALDECHRVIFDRIAHVPDYELWKAKIGNGYFGLNGCVTRMLKVGPVSPAANIVPNVQAPTRRRKVVRA